MTLKTTCEVAVPAWYINSENLGKCRKYQLHYNHGIEKRVMLCSETRLPCPLKGQHQYPVDTPKLPKWMKKVAYYAEPQDS